MLCREFTRLLPEEIEYIRQISGALQFMADTESADVFINCPCSGGDTIVVAQAKPEREESIYKNCVVGLFSRPSNEPAVDRTMRLGVSTKRVMAYNQEGMPVIQVSIPVNFHSKTIGVLTYEFQSSEQEPGKAVNEAISADKKIAVSKKDGRKMAGWTWVLDSINEEAILLVDVNGLVIYRNTTAQVLFKRMGYVEDVLGQAYRNIRLQKTDFFDNDSVVEFKAGDYYLREQLIRIKRENIAFMVFLTDVTKSKNQEKALIHKSIAVKEMHHRIKNSLQMIVSLISLQIRRADSEATREALLEISSRIRSIVLTHQMLEQSGTDDMVSLKEVTGSIANNVMRIGNPDFSVSLSITGDDFEVDSDTATTVALIINELILNSIKHAFNGRNDGEIRIRIDKENVSYCRVTVSDNGSGYNKDTAKHLGSNIVQMLIKSKLRGTVTTDTGTGGTYVTFGFPL